MEDFIDSSGYSDSAIIPDPIFQSSESLTCTDINECITSNPCSVNELCVNTIGSVTCKPKCRNGLVLDITETICIDIDECLIDEFLCNNGECLNSFGNYECVCYPGFEGGNCEDIDECAIDNLCPVNSICRNSSGSFTRKI